MCCSRIRAKWVICGALVWSVLAVVADKGLAQQWSPRRPRNSSAASKASYSEPAAPQKLPELTDPRTGSGFVPAWQRHPHDQQPRQPYQEPQRYQPPQQYQEPQLYPRQHVAVAHRATMPQMPPEQPLLMDEGEAIIGQPEVIDPGMMEPIPDSGIEFETGEFGETVGDCTDGCGLDGGECGLDCGLDCEHGRYCDGICIPRSWVEETSLFVGAHGFKGPLDLGRNGNFGFHEGVNFAGQFGRALGLGPLGLGYQVGAQFVHSNFSGDTVVSIEENTRDQKFLTAGFFRRAPRGQGLQYGTVFDYMNDNYYVDITLTQLRAEMSYLAGYGHELGFWGAFGLRGDTDLVNGLAQSYESTDLYAFFYRYNLPTGGQGRVWVGGTDKKDTLFGVDFRVPLSNRWDFNGAVNYLAPEQGGGLVGSAEESWGISVNLAWYPGRRCAGVHNGPFRSLFGVADNTTFMVDRVQ
ncbi:MAG: DUF6666 family protein [Pirellulales bacterium]